MHETDKARNNSLTVMGLKEVSFLICLVIFFSQREIV